jgi:hypothetical protein
MVRVLLRKSYKEINMDETNPFDQFDNEVNPFDEFDTEALPEQAASVSERSVTLPLPRPNMFASMADDEAQVTYDAYARHPETQRTEDGQLLYRGEVVPAPEGNSGFVSAVKAVGARMLNPFGPVYDRLTSDDSVVGGVVDTAENLAGGVAGGAVNVGRNLAETGVAAATTSPIVEGYKTLTGSEGPEFYEEGRDTLARGMEDTLPKFNPKGTAETIGSIGTEIGAGIVIGNKALAAAKAAGVAPAALEGLATKAPRAIKYLTKKFVEGAVQAAPTAATVDDQSDTLVVGENALIPIMQGLDTSNPDEMEAMINRRMNVLLDAAVVAAPIEVGADQGKKFLKFAYDTFYTPVKKAFSQTAKSNAIMSDLMDAVGRAADPADPNSQEALAAKDRVVQILKSPEFQEMKMSLNKTGVSDIDFRRDTASAVEAGLEKDPSEQADAIRSVFREARKQATDIDDPGFQQTKIASERPVKASERLMQESEEVFGSTPGMERARTGIQEGGQKEVQTAEDLMTSAETNASRAEAELPDKLREGPIGTALAEAEVAPVSKGRQIRNETAEELLGTEAEISKEIDEVSRTKWANIPEGLEADEESLTNVLVDAMDYLTPKMKRALKNAGFDPLAEEGSIVDFKKLQEIRKPLSDEIARMRIRGDKGVQELAALRTNLNEAQPEFVRETAKKKGKVGAKALEDALDYERTVRGPDRKSGLPGELRDIRNRRGLNLPVKEDEEASALHRTLTSDQPKTPIHFTNYIVKNRPEKKDLIVKYAFADASDKLLRKIKSGEGLSSVDPTDVMGSLESYRQILNSNPEVFGKELKELDTFYDSITRNKNDIKKLREIVKTHAANFEKVKKDIYEVRLNDFFEKNGDPKPDGYASLSKVFMNPQATGSVGKGKLDDLIRLAEESGDPMVLDGMKAGWMKLVRDELFTSAPDAASTRSLSAAKTEDFLNETGKSNLLRVGEKLFKGDDGVLIDSLKRVLQPALDTTVSAKSGSSKFQKGNVVREAKEAVAAGVRLKYGPLTRKGTTINTVVGKLLDYVVKNKKQEAALDAIMSDPDGFLKAYDDFVKSTAPTKERARHLFKFFVYSGIYNEGDQNQFDKEFKEANKDSQTEAALPE